MITTRFSNVAFTQTTTHKINGAWVELDAVVYVDFRYTLEGTDEAIEIYLIRGSEFCSNDEALFFKSPDNGGNGTPNCKPQRLQDLHDFYYPNSERELFIFDQIVMFCKAYGRAKVG